MPRNPTVLTTLIGLPLFLVVALGLAFGASFVSRTLRQDPTLNRDAGQTTNTNSANSNTAASANYAQALTTMTATVYQRMTQSALLTNAMANQTSATGTAKVVLAGVCWLAMNPDDLRFFPVGAVQQDFTALIAQYASATDANSACSQVTADAQLQASRLMTLDDDGDGLNAIAEYWYDTSQFSKDTDGDDYRDDEEIANGFNPLGPGTTQSSSR